jgi:hypothetical protein
MLCIMCHKPCLTAAHWLALLNMQKTAGGILLPKAPPKTNSDAHFGQVRRVAQQGLDQQQQQQQHQQQHQQQLEDGGGAGVRAATAQMPTVARPAG